MIYDKERGIRLFLILKLITNLQDRKRYLSDIKMIITRILVYKIT